MHSKVVYLILLITAFSFTHCYRYIRSYRVGGTYKVRPGDTMVEFDCAKATKLESGIIHIDKLIERRRIVFNQSNSTDLNLLYYYDFLEGEYSGHFDKKNFAIKTQPREITFAGFKIEVKKSNAESLTYKIKGEPSFIEEGRQFRCSTDFEETKGKKKYREELQF